MHPQYTIRAGPSRRVHEWRQWLFLCLLSLPLVHVQAVDRLWGGEPLLSLGGVEYLSVKFGRVVTMWNPNAANWASVPGLWSYLEATGDGRWSSGDYGEIERGNDNPGWIISSHFGWTHFGPNLETYGGWVWTERFHWMKFERPETDTYLWVPMMRSWMAVNPDGSFYSFEWRQLTPLGLNRYRSALFGELTTGDFNGWVHSDRYGWMWANGDGTWFWSETRKEWLGVTAEGGIWSTAENRFL